MKPDELQLVCKAAAIARLLLNGHQGVVGKDHSIELSAASSGHYKSMAAT